MSGWVDYKERSPLDFVHFAAVGFGILIALAGVVILSVGAFLTGLVLVAVGSIYFLFN